MLRYHQLKKKAIYGKFPYKFANFPSKHFQLHCSKLYSIRVKNKKSLFSLFFHKNENIVCENLFYYPDGFVLLVNLFGCNEIKMK